jgi:hypothetical protein
MDGEIFLTGPQVRAMRPTRFTWRLPSSATARPLAAGPGFSFTELLKDAANIKESFGTYLEGFSEIKEILYNLSAGGEKGWLLFTRR